ncbi:hypothetical protein OJF2_33480 [Aquisphaera giovannonii]|uniref:Uncharacterized protein n=1 Tax=Aquisphaera giovannonii TaxID=406548 RepID=A0A5B9W3Y8_9BACT|nr:hypothetical protein [Aquisphaera giovannonii]QEH34805.1 hypothetical protein OJF2_33480 [Aquisphaera giovannonii]
MVLGEDGVKGERGLRAWFRDLDRILGGDLTGLTTLRERGLGISARRLSACVVILSMVYGACMGTFAAFGSKGPNLMQVVASMIKVPLLFYLTLLVTLPSLYVFNALVGSRLSLAAVLRLLVASLGVNVAVLASLGPIVAFFSVCTTSYPFMVLFNVAIFAAAGAFGLRFLLQTLHRLNLAASPRPAPPSPPPPPGAAEAWVEVEAEPAGPLEAVPDRAIANHVRLVFRIWVVVFGLVGAQMGWVLRPFIGNPNIPFTWFRARESNFFLAVLQAFSHLFG